MKTPPSRNKKHSAEDSSCIDNKVTPTVPNRRKKKRKLADSSGQLGETGPKIKKRRGSMSSTVTSGTSAFAAGPSSVSPLAASLSAQQPEAVSSHNQVCGVTEGTAGGPGAGSNSTGGPGVGKHTKLPDKKPRRISRYLQRHDDCPGTDNTENQPPWLRKLLQEDFLTGKNLGTKFLNQWRDQETEEIYEGSTGSVYIVHEDPGISHGSICTVEPSAEVGESLCRSPPMLDQSSDVIDQNIAMEQSSDAVELVTTDTPRQKHRKRTSMEMMMSADILTGQNLGKKFKDQFQNTTAEGLVPQASLQPLMVPSDEHLAPKFLNQWRDQESAEIKEGSTGFEDIVHEDPGISHGSICTVEPSAEVGESLCRSAPMLDQSSDVIDQNIAMEQSSDAVKLVTTDTPRQKHRKRTSMEMMMSADILTGQNLGKKFKDQFQNTTAEGLTPQASLQPLMVPSDENLAPKFLNQWRDQETAEIKEGSTGSEDIVHEALGISHGSICTVEPSAEVGESLCRSAPMLDQSSDVIDQNIAMEQSADAVELVTTDTPRQKYRKRTSMEMMMSADILTGQNLGKKFKDQFQNTTAEGFTPQTSLQPLMVPSDENLSPMNKTNIFKPTIEDYEAEDLLSSSNQSFTVIPEDSEGSCRLQTPLVLARPPIRFTEIKTPNSSKITPGQSTRYRLHNTPVQLKKLNTPQSCRGFYKNSIEKRAVRSKSCTPKQPSKMPGSRKGLRFSSPNPKILAETSDSNSRSNKARRLQRLFSTDPVTTEHTNQPKWLTQLMQEDILTGLNLGDKLAAQFNMDNTYYSWRGTDGLSSPSLDRVGMNGIFKLFKHG